MKTSRIKVVGFANFSINQLQLLFSFPIQMEPPRRRIPELRQRPKSGNWSSKTAKPNALLSRSFTLNSSNYEQLSEQQSKSTEDNQDDSKAVNLHGHKNENDFDKLNKQFRAYAKKQEQLLRVSLYY